MYFVKTEIVGDFDPRARHRARVATPRDASGRRTDAGGGGVSYPVIPATRSIGHARHAHNRSSPGNRGSALF